MMTIPMKKDKGFKLLSNIYFKFQLFVLFIYLFVLKNKLFLIKIFTKSLENKCTKV